MKKYLIAILLGAAAGYSFGFSDAKSHDENIVERTLGRVGGSTREKYRTDVDKQMDAIEKK